MMEILAAIVLLVLFLIALTQGAEGVGAVIGALAFIGVFYFLCGGQLP